MIPVSQPLSNLQEELLKVYATGISDEQLLEIKELIAKFFFEKATQEASKIWDEKKYDNTTLQQWLNEN